MKIVKEEKHLHKYLKTIFDIQKSEKQKYIIGNFGFLYFYTPYRCGKFYQKSEDRIAMEYNFNSYSSYTLSQLPNGDFELRENDALSQKEMMGYIELINNILQQASFQYEFDKDDICQLAKMTVITNALLCDNDLKYFNRFKDVEVFKYEDYIIADSNIVEEELNIHTSLAFNVGGHVAELNVQQDLFRKIERDTSFGPIEDEIEEELEKDAENIENNSFENDEFEDLEEDEPF